MRDGATATASERERRQRPRVAGDENAREQPTTQLARTRLKTSEYKHAKLGEKEKRREGINTRGIYDSIPPRQRSI